MVGRCALNIDSVDRMRAALEDSLFSEVVPGVDEDAVPAVIGRALIQLHSDLQRGGDGQALARAAFDEIRLDMEGRMFCPVEAVIAGLEDAAESRHLAYFEARHLASLPWSSLGKLVPNDVALSAESLRCEVEAILHEVEEGFVDPVTAYPDVARSAGILASDLRSRFV